MKFPNTQFEAGLRAVGCQRVAGLDEVGRGSWAGPVVAAALVYDPLLKKIKGIRDSKVLTALAREKIMQQLSGNFDFALGVVAAAIIDASGIVPAIKLAMEQAIAGLKEPPQYLLVDALHLDNLSAMPQQAVIDGDKKVLSIAAASIIAKVTRDRLMNYYQQQFQEYNFSDHKGYGTAAHQAAIKKYGITPIHRRSYRPLAGY